MVAAVYVPAVPTLSISTVNTPAAEDVVFNPVPPKILKVSASSIVCNGPVSPVTKKEVIPIPVLLIHCIPDPVEDKTCPAVPTPLEALISVGDIEGADISAEPVITILTAEVAPIFNT